jgi:uncharacterized membrane protein
VPIGITIWVLAFLVGTLDQTLLVLPEAARPDNVLGFHIPGLGVVRVIAIVLLYRRHRRELLRRACDRRVGIDARPHSVRQVDLHQRQAGERHPALRLGHRVRKALLVEFPYPGCWTIAFLTGTPGAAVIPYLEGEHVSVYVPTTPNPTSGYFIMLPKSRVHELDITVDEALQYIISMGVVAPKPHPVDAPQAIARIPQPKHEVRN